MGSVEGNHHGDFTEAESADRSLSQEASDLCDVFGDPEILPRVGDEYQVELPPLMAVSNYIRLTENQRDAASTDSSSYRYLIGLPIPVMWINEETESQKHEPCARSDDVAHQNESFKSEFVSGTLVVPERDISKCKAETMDVELDQGIVLDESAKLALKQESLMHQMHRECPVPGTSTATWSDTEEASFLLGLYIFGKNLVVLKKFVGSKQMIDILSFYYGKFYRSKSYSRWSECRKMRSRKCIYGHKIFTGLRHNELLSRLGPHVSEESHNILLEVSKSFGEGNISLEEYVFILKSRVGLDALVEAVGIGKGKQDLTGIAETSKSNQVVNGRPEIPVGKACSTLSQVEIVSILTGNFRLSKARSNDLFWEAVWPRLLARGWHSEQPNQGRFANASKQSLVFLLPGIKKFSRRKLIKGSHYFDSVTDVLSKVASDPELLELDMGEDKCSTSKDQNGWIDETKADEEGFGNQQRHCYLKPRIPNPPNRSTDAMKFTVVDTSLAYGKTCKVRELRSLPCELHIPSTTSSSDSEDEDTEVSNETTEVSNSVDTSCSRKKDVNASKSLKINLGGKDSKCDEYTECDGSEWEHQPLSPHMTNLGAKNADFPKEENIDEYPYMMPRKATKSKRSPEMLPETENPMSPVSRQRRRLASYSSKETSGNHILQGPMLQQEACNFGDLEVCEKNRSQVDLPPEMLSSTSASFKGGSPVIGEGVTGSVNLGAGQPHEWPQFDLNEEPICLDDETDEPIQHDGAIQESDGPHSMDISECKDTSVEQPTINPRRQSTRNRPLTTKALEAFACGFLDTKQKRKSRDRNKSKSKLSRRARMRVRAPNSFDTSVMDYSMQETSTAAHHSSNVDGFSELDMVSQIG